MNFDAVIIGAGLVGLACARAIASQGYQVLILEKNQTFGQETSSRNSEVIHAGIYYSSTSSKAFHCVRGKYMLYDYCESHGINFQRCGKLIASTSPLQENDLIKIKQKASSNDVSDLRLLTRREALKLEPELECTAALLSPSTGIVDSHALMLAFLGDAERAGAFLVNYTPVEKIFIAQNGFDIVTGGKDPTRVQCNFLINAAGLHAPAVAKMMDGLSDRYVPNSFLAKGNYFSLAGKSPFSRLVYPIPEAAGLGVHYTLDLAGNGRFGPDVEWIEAIDYSVDETRGDKFYEAIRKYWPRLQDGALSPAYAGIRPKLAGPEASDHDFLIQTEKIHGIPGLVNLFGIESPGLTASMSIAETVASEVT